MSSIGKVPDVTDMSSMSGKRPSVDRSASNGFPPDDRCKWLGCDRMS
jgi:hypothetical protein